MMSYFGPMLSQKASACPPVLVHGWPMVWWLDQPFGKLVFLLVFLTWGLVIVWLTLAILNQLRMLVGPPDKDKKWWRKLW
jgi:hypothetical protein